MEHEGQRGQDRPPKGLVIEDKGPEEAVKDSDEEGGRHGWTGGWMECAAFCFRADLLKCAEMTQALTCGGCTQS